MTYLTKKVTNNSVSSSDWVYMGRNIWTDIHDHWIASDSKSIHDKGIAYITIEARNIASSYRWTPRIEIQVRHFGDNVHTLGTYYLTYYKRHGSTSTDPDYGLMTFAVPVGDLQDGIAENTGLASVDKLSIRAAVRAGEDGTRAVRVRSMFIEYFSDVRRHPGGNFLSGNLGSSLDMAAGSWHTLWTRNVDPGNYLFNMSIPVRMNPSMQTGHTVVGIHVEIRVGTTTIWRGIVTLDAHGEITTGGWSIGDTCSAINTPITIESTATLSVRALPTVLVGTASGITVKRNLGRYILIPTSGLDIGRDGI